MSQKTTNEREREREDTYVLNDPHLRGASWSALELQTDEKGETVTSKRDSHVKETVLLCYTTFILRGSVNPNFWLPMATSASFTKPLRDKHAQRVTRARKG